MYKIFLKLTAVFGKMNFSCSPSPACEIKKCLKITCVASHGGRLCYRAILHAHSIVLEVITAVGTACVRRFAGFQLSVLQPRVTINCISMHLCAAGPTF